MAAMPLCMGCSSPQEQDAEALNEAAPVLPDYKNIVVPANLAPVRFALVADCLLESAQAVFRSDKGSCVVAATDGEFAIDPEKWNEIKSVGHDVTVRIQGRQDGRWVEYDPFSISVSTDSIDPYLCYRLIEPGYEVWGEMGIYQRNLESYEQRAVITNRQTDDGCMNCHSFNKRNPEQMLFHLRKSLGGTYVVNGGKVEKLNTKTPQTISALVYPYWHPSGRYVAFSTNDTQQASHSKDLNRIEVFDNKSDVVIYDVEKHEIFSCEQLKSEASFETFPCFSPDGRRLYYCTADSVNVKQRYQDVHYSLCSIGFDPETATLASDVDTIYSARTHGGSVSFPRISPDGRWLMFTHHGYGNFSIWHKDADLWMTDLANAENGCYEIEGINSQDVDSYHSWSSNGRWVVFSSRRDDGLYTRPYLSHIDAQGNASKPVLVPQQDVHFYDRLMKSYNIPELVSAPVAVTSAEIERSARMTSGTDLTFRGQ